jgi:hypothetical protein
MVWFTSASGPAVSVSVVHRFNCPVSCPDKPDGDIVSPEPPADEECSSCTNASPLVRYTNPAVSSSDGSQVIVHQNFVTVLNTVAGLASTHGVSILVTKCVCAVSCLSPVSCLLSPVSCLLYPVSFILSPVSFVLSPVSFVLCRVSWSGAARCAWIAGRCGHSTVRLRRQTTRPISTAWPSTSMSDTARRCAQAPKLGSACEPALMVLRSALPPCSRSSQPSNPRPACVTHRRTSQDQT